MTDDSCINWADCLSLLRRRARRMGLTPSDAEDLAQRAVFTYWRKRGNALPGRERAYAEAILVREAARDRRSRARRKEDATDEATPRSSGAQRLDEQLHQQRRLQHAGRVMAHFPRTHQQIFALHWWDGLTCEQIASREQLPLGTVKTRIRALRKSLRCAIEG